MRLFRGAMGTRAVVSGSAGDRASGPSRLRAWSPRRRQDGAAVGESADNPAACCRDLGASGIAGRLTSGADPTLAGPCAAAVARAPKPRPRACDVRDEVVHVAIDKLEDLPDMLRNVGECHEPFPIRHDAALARRIRRRGFALATWRVAVRAPRSRGSGQANVPTRVSGRKRPSAVSNFGRKPRTAVMLPHV